jgi:NAD(P)-dependent dehydrogenase (short-subunit alcohol dehydrogenase family)
MVREHANRHRHRRGHRDRAGDLPKFADRGWQVALAGRRAAPLNETAAALDPGGRRTFCQPTDVGDPAQVDALFAAAIDRWGRVDLLVNNAGISLPAVPLEDIAAEDWHRIVSANLSGMFFCVLFMTVMATQMPLVGRG